MASAGERTCFCEFLQAPPRAGLGEGTADVTSWIVWSSAWGKKQGLRGVELTLSSEVQDQEIEYFWFAYEDVIDPLGTGRSLQADMVIRFDNGSAAGVLYDIDGVFPEEVKREEVRVVAVRKKLAT